MSTTKKDLESLTAEKRIKLRDDTAKALNKKLAADHKNEFSEKRIKANVGGGIQVGDTFTLTGEVAIAEIQGSKNVYLAVLTTTGDKISLKSLISQSVAGYNDKTAIDELTPAPTDEDGLKAHVEDENYHVREATFDKKVAGGLTAAEVVAANRNVLTHKTRNDIELYGLISEHYWECKDFKLTYCGRVYKQTIASKNYQFGDVEVKKGARRAMSVSVWKIEAPTK